jgi:hypothetical protein
MSALVSSLVRVVEGTRPGDDVGAEGMCALLKVLSVLPGPWRGQGLRFELEAVLGLALAAVIAGARPDSHRSRSFVRPAERRGPDVGDLGSSARRRLPVRVRSGRRTSSA